MESKLKTIDFKGKAYVEVSERLRYFRENYEGYSLESDTIQLDDKSCVIKATVKDKEGKICATGIAREVNGSSFINKTSYVENCETSAWGRALGNFGIGIEGSVASALEVANAVENQKPKAKDNLEEFEKEDRYSHYIKESYNASDIIYLEGLWNDIKGLYPQTTEEYKQLKSLIFAKKGLLENPGLTCDVTEKLNERTKKIINDKEV